MATTRNWFKDVFLFGVILSGLAAVTAYLLAVDRVVTPESFHTTPLTKIRAASAKLDQAINTSIADAQLQSTNRADSSQIFRRLALSLTGSLPSVEELREIEKIAADEQVHWYVSHLLEDKRTSDYLAERFTRVFVGVEQGPFLIYRRRRFRTWLSDQFRANMPYDRICKTMLTSNGIWTDKPQVNFYTYNIIPDVDDETKPDPIRLAARTSRAFLGMRIDCLQCHDDFLGTMNLGSADDPVEGTQRHFHALASFFSQVKNSVTGIYDDLDADTYQYKLLDDDEESVIEAQVPFSEAFDQASKNNLRVRLANWVSHDENLPFARSVVNRVWAIMFGRGFIQPVDNIPLEGPFPVALEQLAHDFMTNGYDLHRLIRVIAYSEAFQRSSTADFEILSAHNSHFAVFPILRLRPEQVAGSIIQSTSLTTIDATSHIISQLTKFGQETDFVDRFGDLGEDEFNEKSETITQRLLLMNGKMVRERLKSQLNSVTRIADLSPNMETAVETIYLATLSRKPTTEESEFFVSQLTDVSSGQRKRKVVDIYWSLINSVEFVWNH